MISAVIIGLQILVVYCCWSYPSVIRGYTYINSRGGGMMEQWLNNGRNQITDSPHTPLCRPPCPRHTTCFWLIGISVTLSCFQSTFNVFNFIFVPPTLLLLAGEPLTHWYQITATLSCFQKSLNWSHSLISCVSLDSSSSKCKTTVWKTCKCMGKIWDGLKTPLTDLT